MNPYGNEEIAWLRLQDLQREAESRRLTAGGPRSSAMAALRRLWRRSSATRGIGHAAEQRQKLA